MEEREIKWTPRAVQERDNILTYWYLRNKSLSFSVKLNNLFITTITILSRNPEAGKIFRKKNDLYFILVKSYRIYFIFNATELVILSIWDTRRNPSAFKKL